MSLNNLYNRHSLKVTVAPATLPVSVNELKEFLRIDGSSEDTILEQFIQAATTAVELYISKSLITQTRTLTLDWLPPTPQTRLRTQDDGYFYLPYIFNGRGYLDLPYSPIQSITSLQTFGLDNAASTFDSAYYTLDVAGSRLLFNTNSPGLPSNLRERAAVVITYVAGYGSASNVPHDIKLAVMAYASDMYNCRSLCDMGIGCMGLLSQYKDYTEIGI
jgi:hypothetical protein